MRKCGRSVRSVSSLLASVALIAGTLAGATGAAQARHRHGGLHHGGHARIAHAAHHHHAGRARHAFVASTGTGGFLRPTYSSIIVDANTGRTLSAENENAPHHPASVTKVMTLYLLFEQLEKGRLSLDSELTISPHAASQAPSKLGLRPGSTIAVEDAIKAVVTKSANDIACAIAENIAGDEPTFAAMMTRRAHSLGMNGTNYRNASGLPNPQQITTARDLAILGRAIQDRFPRYYRYFATRSFYYAGRTMPNHNHLMSRIEGMDGIKTGYTAASGFNLLTSVHRDGHHIVGVVLGGRSAPQRDTIMANLIAQNIDDGATRRTATAIAERDTDDAQESASSVAAAAPDADVPETPPVRVAAATIAAPAAVKLEPARVERRPEERRVNVASLDLSVPALPAPRTEARVEKARPAVVTATRPEEDAVETSGRKARRSATNDGSTSRVMAYAPTATPSSLRWIEGAPGHEHAKSSAKSAARVEMTKPESGRSEAAKGEIKTTEPKAAKIALVRPAHTGWMIQIGATEDAGEASTLLSRAKAKASLASAHAFTEKVQKGRGTLYRARFAGLEEESAEAACRTLKRSGFSCFATRN